jgi:hypothetical protein
LLFGLRRSAALVDLDLRLTFFGISLPWLAVVLLHLSAILFFVYLAARRKMSSERIHPLSKVQAISALATLAFLLAGTIWAREVDDPLEVVALYLLVITAILLILMVTPDRAEYFKGLWRTRKAGKPRLPWWDDLALNRTFLATISALVLVAATFIKNGANGIEAQGPRSAGAFALAIAVCVVVVAYFGLAHQYFALVFGPRGKIYFGLFLFLAWLVPLLAGSIVEMASGPPLAGHASQSGVIFSLSPIAGIGLAATSGDGGSYSTGIQASAITPALFFAFVFNSLLVSARRMAHRAFLAAAESGKDAAAAAPGEFGVSGSSGSVSRAEFPAHDGLPAMGARADSPAT